MSSTDYLKDLHDIRNLKHDYCEIADRCCLAPDARLAADETIQLFVGDGVLEVSPESGGRQVGRSAIHQFWMQRCFVSPEFHGRSVLPLPRCHQKTLQSCRATEP